MGTNTEIRDFNKNTLLGESTQINFQKSISIDELSRTRRSEIRYISENTSILTNNGHQSLSGSRPKAPKSMPAVNRTTADNEQKVTANGASKRKLRYNYRHRTDSSILLILEPVLEHA